MTTRDRLLAEGMRLFGERGYAATSVAQIEAAAGLSAGSGSLYKHFRSKQELLVAGVDQVLAGGRELTERLASTGSETLLEQLATVVRAGLRRLDEDRDVNRLAFRGLDSFPELMQRFGDGEIGRIHGETTAMLAGLADDPEDSADWAAVAVVLQGATAHYWLMTDLFGTHPAGVDEDHFARALARLTVALLAEVGSTDRDEDAQDEWKELP